MVGFPVLTALVVMPAIAAAIVIALPRTRPELVRVVGFTAAMAVLVLAGYTLYDESDGVRQFPVAAFQLRTADGRLWFTGDKGVLISVFALQDGEEQIVADRLRAILTRMSGP